MEIPFRWRVISILLAVKRLFLAVLIPLQIVRSRKEERVLTEKFGAEYLEYKRKTWF